MNAKPITGADRLFHQDGSQILFTHGKGPFIYDENGKDYIDYICGTGPVILGHSNDEFNRRLSVSLEQGICFPGYGQPHHELAQRFEELTGDKHVITFLKSSSEAMTAAVRCAMFCTNRTQLLRCGFLGWHDVLIADTPFWHEQMSSDRRTERRYNTGFRGVQGDEQVHNWNDLSLDTLKSILDQHGSKIAAFAFDVFQLAFTNLETVMQAVSLCRAHDIQIIYDETKTAGRVSPIGYLAQASEQPDFIVLGKAIGNGAPIALLLGSPSHQEHYINARIGGTYSKELISINAAGHVMDIMTETNGYDLLKKAVRFVLEAFNSIAQQLEISHIVTIISLFDEAVFEVQWSEQYVNQFDMRKSLMSELRQAGVLMLDGHCSFVGITHAKEIDTQDLKARLLKGMSKWKQMHI